MEPFVPALDKAREELKDKTESLESFTRVREQLVAKQLYDELEAQLSEAKAALREAKELIELIEDYRHDFEEETGRLASLSVSLFHEAIGVPGGHIPALRGSLDGLREPA